MLQHRPHAGAAGGATAAPRRLMHDDLCSVTATRHVQSRSGHEMRLTISDVHGGAHCVRADRFGGTWQDWSWDVIPIVRDGRIAHDVAEHHQSPGTMRWREAACYAPPGTPDDAMESIKAAFLSWGGRWSGWE